MLCFQEASLNQSSRETESDIDKDLTCTTHIMFLADSQLGNFMVKYAVLYGFQKKFGARVYLFPKQYRFANKIFKRLSINVVPGMRTRFLENTVLLESMVSDRIWIRCKLWWFKTKSFCIDFVLLQNSVTSW